MWSYVGLPYKQKTPACVTHLKCSRLITCYVQDPGIQRSSQELLASPPNLSLPTIMPLHLLHHKSYHVYNAANIARVRRDEAEAEAAAASAAEHAASNASRDRLEILRARAAGIEPPPKPLLPDQDDETEKDPDHPRPKKKLRTDAQRRLDLHVDKAGLTDEAGHINLFPTLPEKTRKNEEAEKERKEKEALWEARTFQNALGRPCDDLTPWYTKAGDKGDNEEAEGDNGGDKRTEWKQKKEVMRKDWADPMRIVETGVRKLKEVEETREEWRRTREREVGGAEMTEARESRRRRDIRHDKEASPVPVSSSHTKESQGHGNAKRESHTNKTKDRHRHRRRSRSRSRSPKGRDHHHRKRDRRSRSRSRSRSRQHSDERHKRRHHSHRSDTRRQKDSTDNDKLTKLRAEREKREASERAKAEQLLRKEEERNTPGWKPVEGGRYSKQYGRD